MADFDPYYKWLGIPPEEQPANHYRLLAVNLFETDRDVIAAAANRQMAYLQQLASGPDLKQAQKLLGEVSQARVCLLNAKQKKAYDKQLRSALPADDPQEPPEEEQPTEDPGPQAIQPVAARPTARRPTARKRDGAGRAGTRRPHRQKKQNTPLMVAVGGGAAAAVAILIVVLMSGGSSSAKKTARGKNTQAGKSPQGQKDEGPESTTAAGPRKKTSTKPPRNSRAKLAAASATVTKTTVTKTTPPSPAAPNAPQGPAESSEEESARTRLKEKYNLEEDAWAHTWKLVNEQTRKLEALETSGPSGAVGGPEFDAVLKRRVEAKKKAILDRWSKIYNAPPDNGGPLDKEWHHNVNRVVMFPENPDAWYVRDEAPEITSIRAQVEREFASRGPATVDPATVELTEAIRKRYVTLAADREVTKLLEQAGGKLAGPPGDAAGVDLSLADAQTVDSGTPNEADHAQAAGKKNAGSDPNAQTPGEANRANAGGPPPAQQVAADKPPAPQAEEPAEPRTDVEFERNFEFMEKNGSWRHADEGDLKAFMKDAKSTAKEFGVSVKNRVKALNKLNNSQSHIKRLKDGIAELTAQSQTEAVNRQQQRQKKQIAKKLPILNNQLKAANLSLEKYKNNVDNPDEKPDIEKTEEALKVAENFQKKIARLSEKYHGYSSEEFEDIENITITTQANSYAKSLETLRNNFNKQKQNLEAAKKPKQELKAAK